MDDESHEAIQIRQLARTFPSLGKNAPGIDPWIPHELNRWAVGPASSGERHAARFVLAVWDNAADWECGRFDIVEALTVWDEPHRAAFLAWAGDPWWA